MRRLIVCLAALLALSPAAFAAAGALEWPAVHRETKPWSRWWWLGNIADEKSLTSEMEKYAAAGLGGLEITPIYGVRGYEDRHVPFLSPRWMELFEHTLAEARRLHLGIDISTGTGWPFGGPWIADTDAAHYLAHKTYTLAAGESLGEPVEFVQPGLVRYAGPRHTPLAELKQPVTANADLQDLALDQVRFETPQPLVALVAYPKSGGKPLDLTSQVDAAGRLTWTAPADGAPWTLYALFAGQHGKMVERAGPGGEGYAIDHLSSSALQHYLAKFDDTLARGRLVEKDAPGGFRAFFNDSYEVDDAQGEHDFTARFFDEFQRRRGYDLREHLPELFNDSPRSPVLSDYRETVSDLLLSEFTEPWRTWASGHGALIRNQAHGSPANILDLYAASDIPEQEGSDLLAIKLASSAAHVTGKPLASAETGTWLNEHFLSTFSELKTAVDTFLLAGINHNCYHGTAFSPPDDPWPGFQFYASVELNPQNPLWHDFGAFNAYVARAQSFLQAGEPDEDVLLYYNIHDRWVQRGNEQMPHFHGGQRDGVTARETAAALRAAGLGFDYVSDRLLAGVAPDSTLSSGRVKNPMIGLRAGRSRYQAIVIPPTEFMPVETLARLIKFAESGCTVFVVQHLPSATPGLNSSRAADFASLLARINQHATQQNGVTVAKVGAGEFLVGPDLAQLVALRPVLVRENLGLPGVEHVRRRTDDGSVYFLVNRSAQPVEGWAAFQCRAESAALFDPMSGHAGLAAFRGSQQTGVSQVFVQLAPGATAIVQLRRMAQSGPAWTYWRAAGAGAELNGEWAVRFVSGGPQLPAAARLGQLSSWTEFAGEPGRAFSGTAVYTLTFARPAGAASAWELDLGTVADTARVSVNDRELSVLLQAPWRAIIPADALRDQNTLEVAVTNLAANRIADLDRRGVPWKKFYNINMPARQRQNAGPDQLFTAARWTPRPSGLLGPVRLTPLAPLQPTP